MRKLRKYAVTEITTTEVVYKLSAESKDDAIMRVNAHPDCYNPEWQEHTERKYKVIQVQGK